MIIDSLKKDLNHILISTGLKETYIARMLKQAGEYFHDSNRKRVLYTYKILKDDPLYSLSMLESGLKSNSMGEFNTERKKIIERLFKAYEKAKNEQNRVEVPYQVNGIWEDILKQSSSDFVEAFQNRDHEAADKILSNFHRDKISSGLSNIHKYFNSRLYKMDFINVTIANYRLWENLKKKNSNLESVPSIGNPFGYIIDEKLTNPNAIRFNYYTDRIETLLDGIDNTVVVEIGGGYGGLGYFLSKRGFRYIDFDIPEICLIESYFLLNAFPDKDIKLYGEYDIKSLNIRERAENHFDILVMPNFEFQNLPDLSVDLIFNCYGLTEMSELTIKEYYRQIERTCRRYFFHVNHENESDPISIKGQIIPHYNLSNIEISKSIFKNIYRIPEMLGTNYELIPSEHKKNYEYLYERRN